MNRTRKLASRIGIAGVTALCLVLAACGSSDPGAGATPGDDGAEGPGVAAAKTEIAQYTDLNPKLYSTPLQTKAPTGKKMAYVYVDVTSNAQSRTSFEKAAAALGWQLSVFSNPGTPEAIQQSLDQAIAQRPDVIMLAGGAPSITTQQRAEMAQLGITLVSQNNTETDPIPNPPVAELQGAFDQGLYAELVADLMVVAGNGKVAALYPFLSDYSSTVFTADRMESRLKELCPQTCSLKRIPFQVTDIGKDMPSGIVNALRSDPNIKFLALSGSISSGVVSAVKAAGVDVEINGFNPAAPEIQDLEAGGDATWIQSAKLVIPWQMVHSYLAHLDGQKFEPYGESATQPVPPATPKVVLTKDNVAGIDPIAGWNGPSDYEAQFKALWKVG